MLLLSRSMQQLKHARCQLLHAPPVVILFSHHIVIRRADKTVVPRLNQSLKR